MILKTDGRYWSDRYKEGYTGWDIGQVSDPIASYIDQLTIGKDARILVPGAGYGHEVRYLHDVGYTDITVIDIAAEPINQLKSLGLAATLLHGDFFDHEGEYDLILEQTFFCAIDPTLRRQYAEHTRRLLSENGRLAGVLFDYIFDKPGPPFGGSIADYQALFEQHYSQVSLEACYNSIAPRAGMESFIVAKV